MIPFTPFALAALLRLVRLNQLVGVSFVVFRQPFCRLFQAGPRWPVRITFLTVISAISRFARP